MPVATSCKVISVHDKQHEDFVVIEIMRFNLIQFYQKVLCTERNLDASDNEKDILQESVASFKFIKTAIEQNTKERIYEKIKIG
jgi:hypothetical protein